MSSELGDATLTCKGRRIFENATRPPGVNTLEKALATFNEAYGMNHRGGDVGSYKYEKVDDKTYGMICDNPYTCTFDPGILRV